MEPKVYYLLMAVFGTLGLVAKGIHFLIKSGFSIHAFFINLRNKIDHIDERLTKVEGYIFEGPNSPSDPGRSSNDREEGRFNSPFNGVGLRAEPSSDTLSSGDRPSVLGGDYAGYQKGMVHLGLGEHAKGIGDD